MMELKKTIPFMESVNYQERFIAEYYQLETRYLKLKEICKKWDNGKLDFTPTCPRDWYDDQLYHMLGYLNCLINRSRLENIELDVEKAILQDIETFTKDDTNDKQVNKDSFISDLISMNKFADNNIKELEKACKEAVIDSDKAKFNFGNACTALSGFRMVEKATRAMLINEDVIKDSNGDYYQKIEE